MEKTIKRIDIYVIAIALVIAGYFLWSSYQVLGSAPSGIPAEIATSSTALVGTSTPVTLTATSTGCAARIITTRGQAISLSFDWKLSSTTLSETIGHIQGASTTDHYDSGLFGCSVVTAIGLSVGLGALPATASSTVTISTSY